MTQRELEKLLKSPEVLRELEQGLFGDPALWASPAECKAATGAQELMDRKRREIREGVQKRLLEQENAQEQGRRAAFPRRAGKRALQWTAAAACVAMLACYVALSPQNASLATSYDEKVARKVDGYVIIESVEVPPNALKSVGMRISGVDGFEMYSYMSIDEYIEKTGRDPVLLTGGYERIVNISDELDPDRGYTLMIAYELPGERYISTSQFYADDAKEMVFPDGYERTVLNGRTMHCRVEDDSTSVGGSVRLSDDCIFYISMPFEEELDPYLDQLAFASELDTASFAVPPPPTPPPPPPPGSECVDSDENGPADISYETFEEYARDTGNWPLVLDRAYAAPASIEYHTFRAMGDTFNVVYEKDGHKIYAFQRYGFIDGAVYSMEDETYFTTKVLGEYTFHCSVDLIDGSAAGVGVVNGTAFFIIAEKGIDFKEMLKHLYIMSPQ